MLQYPSFKIPTNRDIRIWRYLDLAKYLAILQRQSLFFVRATLLQSGDPFEGSSTKLMATDRDIAARIQERRQEMSGVARFIHNFGANGWLPNASFLEKAAYRWGRDKELGGYEHDLSNSQMGEYLVKTFLLSCWHMNEHESAAMWSLYLQSNEGVCIQSTYRRLRAGLPECVLIGEVEYLDYHTEAFSPSNRFNHIMHKRKSFEHERELRAVFWDMDGSPDAQTYKPTIEDAGLWIPVDLPSLIERVYVNPTAEPWLATVIREVTAKYNLQVPVCQSSLSESPLY
jgi:hypothetical protein